MESPGEGSRVDRLRLKATDGSGEGSWFDLMRNRDAVNGSFALRAAGISSVPSSSGYAELAYGRSRGGDVRGSDLRRLSFRYLDGLHLTAVASWLGGIERPEKSLPLDDGRPVRTGG